MKLRIHNPPNWTEITIGHISVLAHWRIRRLAHSLLSLVFLLLTLNMNAQMWNGQDTLYGNEWINYDQTYFKIEVAKDGLYRLTGAQLQASGIPINTIPVNRFQLFHLGKEIPIYLSSSSTLSPGDYLEFYGQKNRSELDSFLFANPEADLLNPYYSLFTDTAAYFLTWLETDGPTQRYEVVSNDLSGNLPEAEPWFMHESRAVFANNFLKRYYPVSNTSIFYSHFDTGEGFGSRALDYIQNTNVGNSPHQITLNLPGHFESGPNSLLRTRFVCGPFAHQQRISIGLQEPESETLSFNGFKVVDHSISFSSVQIPQNGQVPITIEGLEGNNDKQSVAFISVRYPRVFDFDNASNFKFTLSASNGAQYLEIENFNHNGNIPVLYDLTNKIRLEAVVADGKIKLLLPASMRERQLFLVNLASAANEVATFQPVSFINYGVMNQAFVLISHPDLYSDSQGQNWVQAYADYRSSVEGGNYSTIIIDIQQLYDQFAYGINRHALSMRNFGLFAKKYWSELKYFLIIGKGLEYDKMRSNTAVTQYEGVYSFVPSFGTPASDNLIMTDDSTKAPVAPIGRIAATKPEEIGLYLNKVIDLEANAANPQTIEGRTWMKQILHLGGGRQVGEQQIIKNQLIRMEEVLENNSFGGQVESHFKSSTDPIQTSQSQQIFDRINDGTSIITFFGHTGVGTFDFNIDNPDNYDNAGKYPLILSLGCYSGNIFTINKSISERFCFFEDKGAVAFAASRGIGEIYSLGSFARQYYTFLGGENYGMGIGDVLKATLHYFRENEGSIFGSLKEQFTLHGDPAIKLHPSPGPDYVVDRRQVAFDPPSVNAQIDSIDLKFGIANLGRFEQDSIEVSIRQKLPDGREEVLKRKKIEAPAYINSHEFRLPNLGKDAVGLNTFFIQLDEENDLEELPLPDAELNNDLVRPGGERGVQLYISDNTAQPISPANMAITGNPDFNLQAYTTDALAPERKYILEIDTTALFNSGLKKRKEIVQNGGVIKWKPEMMPVDTTVFYWRITTDSLNAELGYDWTQQSFTYIPESPIGWGQGHYWQWLEGNLDDIQIEENRRFAFVNNFRDIRIRNKLNVSETRPQGFVNGRAWSDFFRWQLQESINIVVVDTAGRIWFNPNPGQYGSINTSTQNPIACFSFPINTTEERAKIIEFLTDVVPDKHQVIFYTVMSTNAYDLKVDQWAQDSVTLDGQNLFNVIEAQGALRSRELIGNMRPYIFSYVKNQQVLGEELAETVWDEINFELSARGYWYEGSYRSPKIGPAANWDKLLWDYKLGPYDSLNMSVIGIKTDGTEDSLITNVLVKDTSLQFIDASVYPYLKLGFYAEDRVETSPAQIKYWRILYQELPEAAVNPNLSYSFARDTLQQGEPLQLNVSIESLASVDMDSLLVKYTIIQEDNAERETFIRYAPLPAGTSQEVQFNFTETQQLSGSNKLVVELNPNDDQPEQNHANNYLIKDFYVIGDRLNPVLDVTFDGQRIMDGDLVSCEPEIMISLQDENEFLLLNDTSNFALQLLLPNGSQRVINYSELEYYPAQNQDKNRAEIIWRPAFEESGDYTLIVRGKDASGNLSGAFDYKANFKVIKERLISNVLNYPNPFSTSTQFVYTITGDEPPAFLKIQILTVSGQVVREITQDELGPLKIGTHRTEYAWDGRDEFGDRLANGVYLYQVIAKDIHGKDFGHYDNGSDEYFKGRMGKMVILR